MVKNNYPNLLIIAGTGTKSGKTTMACRIIEQFKDQAPVAIKISPHFHTTSEGVVTIEEGPGFAIYEETISGTAKDTERMLAAGAARVYLLLVWDSEVQRVFKKVIDKIPGNTPVICESPALRNYYEPGLFILMSSEITVKRQDLRYLEKLPHLKFKLEELSSDFRLQFDFREGRWKDLRTRINEF